MHIDKVYRTKATTLQWQETPTEVAIRRAHTECRQMIKDIYPEAKVTNVYLSVDAVEVSVYYTLSDSDGTKRNASVDMPIENQKLTGCSSFELLLEPKNLDYLLKECTNENI